MSREKKFHQWIEEQNQEEKARVWSKIQEEMNAGAEEKPTVVEEITHNAKPKWKWWKGLAAVTASIAVVCLSMFAVMKIFLGGEIIVGDSSTDEMQSETSENGETSQNNSSNENRYCTAEEYTSSVTEKTIKQYAQETGKAILYFDWYDTTEYLEDTVYTLNETNQIICYREDIIHPETGDFLTIYVTEQSMQMDILDKLNSEDTKIYRHNEINISWGVWFTKGYASFEYGDYKYNIELKEPLVEDDILEYAKLLLGE